MESIFSIVSAELSFVANSLCLTKNKLESLYLKSILSQERQAMYYFFVFVAVAK
jgi:hypothetical protein